MLSSGFGDERLEVLWHRLQRTRSLPRGESGVSHDDGDRRSESDEDEETEDDALILSMDRIGDGDTGEADVGERIGE